MSAFPPSPFRGGRLLVAAGALAVLGALALALGGVADPRRALLAYLTAFTFAVSIAVGALVLQMIGHAAGARWMSVIRRPCEAVAFAVVPLAVLFVPIALGLDRIYPWAAPPAADVSEHARHLLAHKRPYLSTPFFIARTAGYFAVWITCAVLLRRWGRRHGPRELFAPDDRDVLVRERVISSALLPLVGLAITFAAFDWLMSLDPLWVSTLFGIYYLAGGFLAAIAAITLIVHAGLRSGALEGAVTGHHFHALGRLLLAFTAFWAYVAYFQVFIIAIADRPSEVTFYLERLAGDRRWSAWVLGVGHFALPFLLLLPRAPKHRPGWVAAIAAWLLVMHAYDVRWLAAGGVGFHWLDVAALAAVVGVATLASAWSLRGAPLVAIHDPFLRDGVAYASPT